MSTPSPEPPQPSDAAKPAPPAGAETLILPSPDALAEAVTLPPAPTAAAAPAIPAPVSVPGYEILGVLGRGGMGVVYKARHVALKRVVALKMILAGPHASPEELDRFRTEAEAVARLAHPNIVQIYDIGEYDGRPYFSLEFVDGGALNQKLSGTPWPERQAVALVAILARALAYAHGRAIVHRDLKPANVLLTPDGVPKVTDFGLAKRLGEQGQTQTGAVMGTPSYMAPEQAAGQGKEVGPAADVYALGVLLYELVTGRPPFRAATPLDTMLQVLSDEPPPPRRLNPKLSRDVQTACLKCLEKDPRRRYASAELLADDLGRIAAGEPIQARAVGEWGRCVRWVKRHPIAAALAALLTPLLFLIASGWARGNAKPGWLFIDGALAAGVAISLRPRAWTVLGGAALVVLATYWDSLDDIARWMYGDPIDALALARRYARVGLVAFLGGSAFGAIGQGAAWLFRGDAGVAAVGAGAGLILGACQSSFILTYTHYLSEMSPGALRPETMWPFFLASGVVLFGSLCVGAVVGALASRPKRVA
jgi:hypothetical protein